MMKGDPQLPQVSEDEAIVPEEKKMKKKTPVIICL
jgi:hypothetical protein